MRGRPGHGEAADAERTLGSTRAVVLALAAGPLAALAAVVLLPPPPPSRFLVTPAALAGIVALAGGYRWYRTMLERAASLARPQERASAFRTGTIVPLAVTEAAALFGAAAYYLSREPFALVGVGAHLILAGALWPTRARLEGACEGPETPAPPREKPGAADHF